MSPYIPLIRKSSCYFRGEVLKQIGAWGPQSPALNHWPWQVPHEKTQCGVAQDTQGTKGGTLARDLRGYLGDIQGCLRGYLGAA